MKREPFHEAEPEYERWKHGECLEDDTIWEWQRVIMSTLTGKEVMGFCNGDGIDNDNPDGSGGRFSSQKNNTLGDGIGCPAAFEIMGEIYGFGCDCSELISEMGAVRVDNNGNT